MAESLEKPHRGMEDCECGCACCGSQEDEPEREIARLESVRKELQDRIAQLLKKR